MAMKDSHVVVTPEKIVKFNRKLPKRRICIDLDPQHGNTPDVQHQKASGTTRRRSLDDRQNSEPNDVPLSRYGYEAFAPYPTRSSGVHYDNVILVKD